MSYHILTYSLVVSLGLNIWFVLKEFGPKGEANIYPPASPVRNEGLEENFPPREGRGPTARPPDKALASLLAQIHDRTELEDQYAAWARNSPREALEWAENHAEGIIRMDLLERGVAEWGALDPEGAAVWILGMANDFTYESSVLDLAGKWGKSDGFGAASWISKIPERALRKGAAEALADTWGRSDPDAAAAWSLAFERENPDSPAFGRSLAAWAERNPLAARSHFDSLPFDETVANGASLLASASAESDPTGTIDWARSIEDPSTRWDAVNCAIDSWAQVRPREAAEFVSGMGESERLQHLDTVIRHWSASDNGAAEAWVGKLHDGEFREAALASLAQSLMESAPSRSMDWALKLGAESAREKTCRETYSVWLEEDPRQAAGWLRENKSIIPASLAEGLLALSSSLESR